jgi:replication factor C large subunit
MPLVQKYKPRKLADFVDHAKVVDLFLKWVKNWKPGSKALLFHGPPGVGKTALVEAYCDENKTDLIEMNASDFRSALQIREVLGKSMQQQSLFRRGKIFLIDEIDGLMGREDMGGVGEIIDIIKGSMFPIILTANDPWNAKLRSLRSYCTLVQFGKIYVWDIEKRLKKICDSEKVRSEPQTLKALATMSKGDLRSAINDLETIIRGKDSIDTNDLASLSSRERVVSIFEVLRNIFKSRSALAAKLAMNDSDKEPDEIFWWIENNVVNEYESPEEIADAYDALSRADIFKGRIATEQNWRFLAYTIDIMTAGVAMAKKDVYRKFTKYQYPSNIIALGRSKAGRASSKQAISILSKNFHCSTKKLRSEYLPFLKIMLKNKNFKKSFQSELNIDSDALKNLV